MPVWLQCTIKEEGEGEEAGKAFVAKPGKILYHQSRILVFIIRAMGSH